MPSPNTTVHKVSLSQSSTEYQDVLRKIQATAGGVNIQKIERIQNPHLYQSYMVGKQKMDKDLGGNSERKLFHGTDSKNVTQINAQGFNRSFCGAHGKCGLRWLSRVISKYPPYRARVRKGNVVNFS